MIKALIIAFCCLTPSFVWAESYNSIAQQLFEGAYIKSGTYTSYLIESRVKGETPDFDITRCHNEIMCRLVLAGNYFSVGNLKKFAEVYSNIPVQEVKKSLPEDIYDGYNRAFSNLKIGNMKSIPVTSVISRDNVKVSYKKWSSQYHVFPIVEVKINGKKTPIGLDTGSPMSSITPEFAKNLNIHTIDIGTITSKNSYAPVVEIYRFGLIHDLYINGLMIKNLPVMIGSSGYSDVLGLNLFYLFKNITLYDDHILINAMPSKKNILLRVSNLSDVIGLINKRVVIAKLDGKKTGFEVDTGNPLYMENNGSLKNCNKFIGIYYDETSKKPQNYACYTPVKFSSLDNKIRLDRHAIVQPLPESIADHYLGAGFLSDYPLYLSNTGEISGFFKPE